MSTNLEQSPSDGDFRVGQQNVFWNYAELAQKVRDEDPDALEDLERIFGGGLQFFLTRANIPVLERHTFANECFSILRTRIKADPSLNSTSIPKVLLAIVKGFTARYCSSSGRPAEMERATYAVNKLSEKGKKAVASYFASGQSQHEICTRLRITVDEFERYKSEAKLAFRHVSHDVGNASDSKPV